MAFQKIAAVAGFGVTGVILTVNALLGATGRPLGEAPPDEIVALFADHAWVVDAVAAMAAVVWVLMTIFGVGIVMATRDRHASLNPWAVVGLVGITMQNVVFGRAIATDAVMAGADDLAAQPDIAGALWDMHTVAMTMNHISIAIAILGFGLAATASGLMPGWTRPVVLVGSALLLISGATAPQAVNSDIPPIGVPGVFIWLAWVAFAATRLLRTDSTDHAVAGADRDVSLATSR